MKTAASLFFALVLTVPLHAADPLWDATQLSPVVGADTSLNHWTIGPQPLEITQTDEGLSFVSPDHGEAISSSSRYVKVAPGYGYLSMDATYEGVGSYKYFYVGLTAGEEATVVAMGGAPQSGVITVPVSEQLLANGIATLRVDVISGTVRFSRLTLEAEPVPRLELHTNAAGTVPLGETMEIVAQLEKPAEGVTISFIHGRDMRPFKINGAESIELVPDNEEATRWKGEIAIQETNLTDLPTNPDGSDSPDGTGGTLVRPGSFLLRADVLIGDIDKPIWTVNQSPITVR